MNTPDPKPPLLTRFARASLALTLDTLSTVSLVLRAVDTSLANRAGATQPIPVAPTPAAPFWHGVQAEAEAAAEVIAQLVGLGWPAEEIRWSLDDHNGVVTVMAQVPLEKSGAITTTTRRLHRSKERGDSAEALQATRLELLVALVEDARALREAPMVATADQRKPPADSAVPSIVMQLAPPPAWTEKQIKIVDEIHAAGLNAGWSGFPSTWTWTVLDLGSGNYSVAIEGPAGANAFSMGSSLDGALRNLRDQLELRGAK